MTIVKKLWGQERILHNGGGYCIKELTLNFGWQSSLHMHPIKGETFFVVAGIVELELGKNILRLSPGDHATIAPGEWHRFKAISATATMIEASTEHSDEDIMRREESRRT